jgi:mannose-1-phosphate guanylyltransferase
MKAFLLAAGHGTRLRPLTDRVPKCLVPIAGKPMLQIWFDQCRRAGITEILINLHAHADQVAEFVTRHAGDLEVTLFEEPELLGSAGTLRANRGWLGKGEEFWVLYADVLNSLDFSVMLAAHRQSGMLATLGTYHVHDPQHRGIVTTDIKNRITAFIEKPQDPPGNMAFSGVMVASPAICDAIPATTCPDIGHDLLPRLIGKMKAFPIRDYLIDIGTPENYERAQREWPRVALAMN